MFKIENLLLNQLNDSLHLRAWFFTKNNENPNYFFSLLQEIGQLEPILVWREKDKLFLLDGLKRVEFYKNQGKTEITALVIETSASNLIKFVFLKCKDWLLNSAINKIRFIQLATNLQIPVSLIVDELLPLIEFQAYAKLYEQILRIFQLSFAAQEFCFEKNLSFKQCSLLSSYKPELIRLVLIWFSEFTLSSSLVFEFLDAINDILERDQLLLDDLISQPEFRAILNSLNIEKAEKLARLRELIQSKKYPNLFPVVQELDTLVNRLQLSNKIQLSWDKTLEKKEVALTFRVTNEHDLKQLLDFSANSQNQMLLKDILGKF